MTSIESICSVIRKKDKDLKPRFSPFSGLKMSALNDAVSKAITGKPYSQIIAGERAGMSFPVTLPAPHLVDVSNEYGIDRSELASAIAMAYRAIKGDWKTETREERFGDKYFPFPEHESALSELEQHVNSPINGKHVALVGDYTCGISTIFKHFRFKRQPNAWDHGAPDYFERFVMTGGIGTRLEDWTQSLFLSMRNFDYTQHEHIDNNLRGKLAFREGIKLAQAKGVDTILVDEITGPFKSSYGPGCLHFGKGLEAFAKSYPFRLIMGCSPNMKGFRKFASGLAQKTTVIEVRPLRDSSVLRLWIERCDQLMNCSGYGAYDDEMVSAILSVAKGNTLLIGRYVHKVAELSILRGFTRTELRARVVELDTIGRNLTEPHPWAVDNFLEFGKLVKHHQP